MEMARNLRFLVRLPGLRAITQMSELNNLNSKQDYKLRVRRKKNGQAKSRIFRFNNQKPKLLSVHQKVRIILLMVFRKVSLKMTLNGCKRCRYNIHLANLKTFDSFSKINSMSLAKVRSWFF